MKQSKCNKVTALISMSRMSLEDGHHNNNFLQQRFMYPKVPVMCFSPVEDGDALDPCILSTLRKLQDGYFAGARSVCACRACSPQCYIHVPRLL